MGEKMAYALQKKNEEDPKSFFEARAPKMCSTKTVRERWMNTSVKYCGKLLHKLLLSYVYEIYKNSICSYPCRYWG